MVIDYILCMYNHITYGCVWLNLTQPVVFLLDSLMVFGQYWLFTIGSPTATNLAKSSVLFLAPNSSAEIVICLRWAALSELHISRHQPPIAPCRRLLPTKVKQLIRWSGGERRVAARWGRRREIIIKSPLLAMTLASCSSPSRAPGMTLRPSPLEPFTLQVAHGSRMGRAGSRQVASRASEEGLVAAGPEARQ